MARRWWMIGAVAVAAGCGAGTGEAEHARPVPVSSAAETNAGGEASDLPPHHGADAQPKGDADAQPKDRSIGMPGSSFDSPLHTCGAGESYATIGAYECPDGSVPLGGNPRAGRRARLGSSRSHVEDPPSIVESHIVDIYEVPCPSGPVRVYVCMYHCPPGRSAMD